MKNLFLATVGTIVMASSLIGQQEAQFTQYMDNMVYFNPAYAGSRDALSLSALHRQQWVGIDGAPVTQTFSGHSPLKYESLGLGVSMLNDRVGPLNQTWLNVDFSYTLRFDNHDGRLSFGLKGGLNIVNADFAGLDLNQVNDPSFAQNYQNEILPNLGAGIYYHSDQFFAGAGIPRMINNSPGAGDLIFDDRQHTYLMAGGYFKVNRMLKVRPSMMYKMTSGAPFAMDGTLAFIFYDKFWLGSNYRFNESIGLFAQYQISNQFKAGYAFDITTNSLMRHNMGSHEIIMTYDFIFKNKKITSPRYF